MVKKTLARYRAKRDFRQTPEPSGSAAVRPAAHLRFVIQKHDATRLHYDLRLELGGVFKSWAVTRGPSLNPADKRLAVEVEDHPLDYGDFEGTIPEDQYGGGTVLLWDRGFWAPEAGTGDPATALRKGELKFILAGRKLQGSWVLVRMRHDRERGKRTNWLLIKHRDGYAREDGEAILKKDRSVASGRTMGQIAAGTGKGPEPFMTASSDPADPDAVWNSRPATSKRRKRPADLRQAVAVRKGGAATAAMPRFVPPELCRPVAIPPEGDGWGHEIKLDGYRMQLRVEDGKAEMRTGKGLDWTAKFDAIAQAAANFPDCLIDGEAVVLDAQGIPDFGLLQDALSERRSDRIAFFAFDLLFLDGEDLRRLPLTDRKARLETVLSGLPAPADNLRFVPHLAGSGRDVLASACRMGLEGIISKRLSAPYRSERSGAWTKAKCRAGQEVVIAGWTGTRSKLRSLVAGVYRNSVLVPVGRIGTGFDRTNSARLLKSLNPLATRDSPFAGYRRKSTDRDVIWVRPELVAEIEFAGWTGGGQVRQAAFKGLRADKPAREVRAETPAPTQTIEAAMPKRETKRRSKSKSTDTAGSRVLGIAITKPDKALWPAAGAAAAVTKIDLARYLEAVAGWMLPHIKGRPCSVVRAPDGIEAQTFFQRHALPGQSDLVTLTKVSGDRKPYVQIDSAEALIALAQTAAVEFHPRNCA
ncbi:MAG: DNA ligase D, partial [Hyphomicrobiaceae bacterium]